MAEQKFKYYYDDFQNDKYRLVLSTEPKSEDCKDWDNVITVDTPNGLGVKFYLIPENIFLQKNGVIECSYYPLVFGSTIFSSKIPE